MQFFSSNDTLFQALKRGEIDYARKISPEQFKQLQGDPVIKAVNGASNGWTELGFNTYGTGTGKTIKGGGPSTKALQDPAFRDALGYAIDKQKLVDSVISGLGTIGTTQIPPVNKPWHTEPTDVRTFDLEVADQKLTAAGYVKDASGKRLDKEASPSASGSSCRTTTRTSPRTASSSRTGSPSSASPSRPKIYDSDTLVDLMLPPEAGGASNKADYDLFIWDLVVGPGPERRPRRVQVRRDRLLVRQPCGATRTTTSCTTTSSWRRREDARKAILTQMQQMWYDAAPYHILYYDDNLHAYRTDKFAGWQNQPANGTPLFAYGIARLHAPHRRHRGAEPDAGPDRVGRPAAHRPGRPRRRPGGSGTGDVERRRADPADRSS